MPKRRCAGLLAALVFFLLPFTAALAQEVSLQSYNYRDLYVRHYNFRGEITEIKSEVDRKDATFQIVPGLADPKMVSLESVNYPDHYLADQGGRLVLQKRQAGNRFERAATFKKVPGLKLRTWVSFESLERPAHYIRHRYFHLYVEQGTDDLFRQDATFRLAAPLYASVREATDPAASEASRPADRGSATAQGGANGPSGPEAKPPAASRARGFHGVDRQLAYLRDQVGVWPPRFAAGEVPKVWAVFDETVKELKGMEAQDPGNVEIQWRLGECCVLGSGIDTERYFWEEARKHLNSALQLDPRSARAYAALGLSELLSHRKTLLVHRHTCVSCIADARRNYEKALELAVEPLSEVHLGLAYVYYYQRNYSRSLEQADRYVELVPGDQHLLQFRREVAVSGKFYSGYRPSPDTSFILEPAELEAGRVYPVLIALPFTGGTAADLLRYYLNVVGGRPCFVLVPPGAGSSADHSWEGFSACIERYERHIQKGLARLSETYGGKTGKRYLAGYSLGGDLSWAIAVRNPEEYSGAILMGTRCGYPAKAATVETLRRQGFRAYFAVGDEELAEREEAMKKAVALFAEAGVEHQFQRFPGEHEPADPATFAQALEFLFR